MSRNRSGRAARGMALLPIILLVAARWVALVPMAALAGILLVVAYNMSEWRVFGALLRGARGDALVLFFYHLSFCCTCSHFIAIETAKLDRQQRFTLQVFKQIIIIIKQPSHSHRFAPIRAH